jgi:hypothetical protein
MIAPVVEWQGVISGWLGEPPRILLISLFYVLSIGAAPVLLVGAAAAMSRNLAKLSDSKWRLATRYAYAFVPLGFAMWLAHHGFHLFTSYATIVPVTQRMSLDFGLPPLGQPEWQQACCAGVAEWIVKFELLALDFGLLASLLTGYRIAGADAQSGWRTVKAFAPWAVLLVLLFALGVWIVTEPMEMRGTLTPRG